MGAYKTICKDCIFRKDSQVLIFAGRTQEIDGCSINKINHEKAKLEQHKDGQTYYTLDYICKYCRNYDWAEEKGLLNKNDDGVLKVIREENTIHSDVIIILNQNHLLKDLELIVDKIKNPLIKKVIFSINNQKLNTQDIYQTLSKLNKKWHFIHQIEDTPFYKQINDCFKYVVSPYYIVTEKLSQYNDSLPSIIDYNINERDKKFCMVTNEGYDQLIMQSLLHKMNHGFYPTEIAEKYKETEWNNLIITHNQLICP